MIHIDVAENIQFDQGEVLVHAAVSALERVLGRQNVELTIAVAGDHRLRQLNRHFRGVDAVTDVLSFPADEFDPDNQIRYIGDIAISYPQAKRQADRSGHPLIDELQLLVVHGVIHLLGYDHSTDEEKQLMWELQAEILQNIGCNITEFPE